MPRLHLIVEGQTEQAFAAAMLAEHLAAKGVNLLPAQLPPMQERSTEHIAAD